MYQTISVIFSINNTQLKDLVNIPNDEVIEIVLNTSDYVMLEESQYLLIKKELTMTEDRHLNEDFGAAKWKSRMTVSYTHLDVYKRQRFNSCFFFLTGSFHLSFASNIIPKYLAVLA